MSKCTPIVGSVVVVGSHRRLRHLDRRLRPRAVAHAWRSRGRCGGTSTKEERSKERHARARSAPNSKEEHMLRQLWEKRAVGAKWRRSPRWLSQRFFFQDLSACARPAGAHPATEWRRSAWMSQMFGRDVGSLWGHLGAAARRLTGRRPLHRGDAQRLKRGAPEALVSLGMRDEVAHVDNRKLLLMGVFCPSAGRSCAAIADKPSWQVVEPVAVGDRVARHVPRRPRHVPFNGPLESFATLLRPHESGKQEGSIRGAGWRSPGCCATAPSTSSPSSQVAPTSTRQFSTCANTT